MSLPASLMTAAIRKNNQVWRSIIYTEIVESESYQVCLTPELEAVRYMNAAQALRSSSISEIEEIFEKYQVEPAIYVDPYTPFSIVQELKSKNYSVEPEESEIWRCFDLSQPFQSPEGALKERVKGKVQINAVSIDAENRDFRTFLQVVQSTNGASDVLMKKMESNMIQSRNSKDVSLQPLLVLCQNNPAATICLGVVGKMGFLTLGGTLPAFRRMGIFKWMRLICLTLAKAQGCDYVFSNTAASNHASHGASDQTGFSRGFLNQLWIRP